MAMGIVGEAQTAAAVLGHNFPDSPWYKDAYTLVAKGGLEPREDSNPGSARLSAASRGSLRKRGKSHRRCWSSWRFAILF